ncbi:MAG: hypothetical protein HOC91_03955, partial [Nitrospinaceae bacterium]|nr:hypothetical protein [Nitrospinaceae bacterium]
HTIDTDTQRTDAEILSVVGPHTDGAQILVNAKATASALDSAQTTAIGSHTVDTDTDTQRTDTEIVALSLAAVGPHTDGAQILVNAKATASALDSAQTTAIGPHTVDTDTDTQRTDGDILGVVSTAGYVTGAHTSGGGSSVLDPYVSVNTGPMNGLPGPHIIFNGANLHIQDGTGETWKGSGQTTFNGLGNLIVGYDEANLEGDTKTGSHNIVIGSLHSYSGYGNLLAGADNNAQGHQGFLAGMSNTTGAGTFNASVSGGQLNSATANYSSVSGGYKNKASGVKSSVSAGFKNTASGETSSISGGAEGKATKLASSISGGVFNLSNGIYTSVSGGYTNQAGPGSNASVSGGSANRATAGTSSISGGFSNDATGGSSHVSGGRDNVASGNSSSITSGFFNNASGNYSSVTGGKYNKSTGKFASVSGGGGGNTQGNGNHAIGEASSISGGHDNRANGAYSAIAGGASNRTGTSAQYASISAGVGNIVTSYAESAEEWVTATLQSGWQYYGSGWNTPGFYKDSDGRVHLRGLVRYGSTGGPIFTLPAGYRPAQMELIVTETGDPVANGRIDILPDGGVWLRRGANSYVTLDGLSFRAGS